MFLSLFFSHLVLSKNGGSLPTCLKNKAFFYICWLVLNQYQHATTKTSHLHIQPNDIVIYLFVFSFPGGGDSNKGKSKKWKRILQFPHISVCIDLKEKLGKPKSQLLLSLISGPSTFKLLCQTDICFQKFPSGIRFQVNKEKAPASIKTIECYKKPFTPEDIKLSLVDVWVNPRRIMLKSLISVITLSTRMGICNHLFIYILMILT